MLICQTIHTNFLLCPSHSQSSRVTWWIQPRLTWVQTNSGGVRVRINCTSLRMKAPRETEVVKPHGTGSAVLESFTVYWLCPEDELTSTTVQLHRPDDITDRQQGTNDANKDTADLQRDDCSTTQTSRRYWPAARWLFNYTDIKTLLTCSEAGEERSTEACHVHVLRAVECAVCQIRDELHQETVATHSAVTSDTRSH